MTVLVGKDENEWSDLVWTWFHTELQNSQRVFIPSGATALPFYRKMSENPSTLLKSLSFVQLDEILTGPLRGSFKNFFQQHLSTFKDQFEWVTSAAEPAEICVLGVGINGHVAFHEPGLPKDFTGGCVRLSPETLQYLKLSEPTWAVTYGVGSFMKAKKVLILARGEKKKQVLQSALTSNLPVSWMLRHPNVTLITDFSFSV